MTAPWEVLWAKTGPDRTWHPLGAHMTDAALVGIEIWDHWLAPATRRWLAEPLGSEDCARAMLGLLAGCHDLGKASPAFQVQVDWLAASVEQAGFSLESAAADRAKAPHAVVSAAAMAQLLRQPYGWSLEAARRLASIVGAHHGWFPAQGFLRDPERHPDLHGWSKSGSPWMEARAALLKRIVELVGAGEVLERSRELDLGRARELSLAGYVVLADWIASNPSLFPLSSRSFEQSYQELAAERAGGALSRLGWHRWNPPATDAMARFHERFGFPPNELQRAVAEAINQRSEVGLMLIEAPMGIGKTEAALVATEALATSQGMAGVFLGLPTQATATQMLSRMTRWLPTLGPGRYVVELAHGKANQVAQYRELQERGTPSCVDLDGEETGAEVFAAAWFSGPKRRLLAPFVVGTVDQVLIAAARVRHVALRHVGLQGKVVIVDEVHAYDAYMSVFLHRALRWLGEAGVPVLLMSATLPPKQRQALLDSYAGRKLTEEPSVYPAVTVLARGEEPITTAITSAEQPKLMVPAHFLDERDGVEDTTVAAAVAELARRGANVLVVRNTVARAQRTYRQLAGILGADRVSLLHARFVASRRAALEAELVRRFGRGGDRPQGHVVVGTQVLEQSLDIDFDALVTDLAPVDLLLQRLGRVYRHPTNRRPDNWEGPVLIIGGIHGVTSEAPIIAQGSSGVYGDFLLLRTAAVLRSLDAIILPDDIPDLVARVYGDDVIVPRGWEDAMERASKRHLERQRTHRADAFAIEEPERLDDLLELSRIGIDDRSDDDPLVRAAVRDSEPSVEVVLATGQPNGRMRVGNRVIDPKASPTPEELDAILGRVVRLPAVLSGQVIAGKAALINPAGWQKQPWLRGIRLVLLDDSGIGPVGNSLVHYADDVGLEVVGNA